jgi:hypothetical protein
MDRNNATASSGGPDAIRSGGRVLLTLKHVEIAIEPARWALLSHAVAEGGFAASAAADITAAAGLTLRYKNARNHADTLEGWNLVERLPHGPVYLIPTTDGRHVHACLAKALGQPVPTPASDSRLVAIVAEANAGDFELLMAAPDGGVSLGEELRRRVRDAPWTRRGAIRVEVD